MEDLKWIEETEKALAEIKDWLKESEKQLDNIKNYLEK